MSKPSIFSKDYEKQMRKRKIRITWTIIIIMLLIAFSIFHITNALDLSNIHNFNIFTN